MTITVLLLLSLVALVLGALLLPRFLRGRRVREWRARPFPGQWEAWLREKFPRYRNLPVEVAEELRACVQVFVADKNFEACGGLERVTEEMKVLIAGQACLLLVGLPRHDYFRALHSILVYPGEFRDRGDRRFGLRERERTMLGESWESGSVILSWDNVIAGAANADDGINVVFHEFAHQLDQIDGRGDGVPVLPNREAYRKWADTFKREYDRLVEEADTPEAEPLMDPYGAENPAEFFAVATETFFEESEAMREEHPELYEALSEYYGLDPVGWACE